MALKITTSIGGSLVGAGSTISWCGSCGCEGSTTARTFNLGRVGPGTYEVRAIGVAGCNVKSGGQPGVFAAFHGKRLTNPADGGEWIYASTSLAIYIVEDPNTFGSNPCDCVNGGCVPKTTYNTPGIYANLAACQSGCAKNSNCTGECVDPAEIVALKQAVNTLQSRICK